MDSDSYVCFGNTKFIGGPNWHGRWQLRAIAGEMRQSFYDHVMCWAQAEQEGWPKEDLRDFAAALRRRYDVHRDGRSDVPEFYRPTMHLRWALAPREDSVGGIQIQLFQTLQQKWEPVFGVGEAAWLPVPCVELPSHNVS